MSVFNPDPLTGYRNIGVEDAAQPSRADLLDVAKLRCMTSALSLAIGTIALIPEIDCAATWCMSREEILRGLRELRNGAIECADRLKAGEAREEEEC